jgi:hypothetical protein
VAWVSILVRRRRFGLLPRDRRVNVWVDVGHGGMERGAVLRSHLDHVAFGWQMVAFVYDLHPSGWRRRDHHAAPSVFAFYARVVLHGRRAYDCAAAGFKVAGVQFARRSS